MWNHVEVITAMVSPFTPNGEVDYSCAKKIALYLAENGSDAILVAGTTGESPTLTYEEKLQLFTTIKEAVGDKVKVIAGTGTNSTSTTIALSKEAEARGVDALLLVTPYYNKPPQRGLIAHFASVARFTKLPVILYNVPGRTGVNMTPQTVAMLAEEPNIIGLKEASGNLDQVSQIMRRVNDNTNGNFIVWSGDDSLTLPMLALGVTGIISVASHLMGNQIKLMIKHFKSGNFEEARKLHEKLLPFFHACFLTTNPIPIKGALAMAGLSSGSVRPPLVELDENEKLQLKEVMYNIGLLGKTLA